MKLTIKTFSLIFVFFYFILIFNSAVFAAISPPTYLSQYWQAYPGDIRGKQRLATGQFINYYTYKLTGEYLTNVIFEVTKPTYSIMEFEVRKSNETFKNIPNYYNQSYYYDKYSHLYLTIGELEDFLKTAPDLTEGKYKWQARTIDNSGNYSFWVSYKPGNNFHFGLDFRGPKIIQKSVYKGYKRGTVLLYAKASDATSGVKYVSLYDKQQHYPPRLIASSNSSSIKCYWNSSNENGPFSINIEAGDKAGNKMTQYSSLYLNLDNFRPQTFAPVRKVIKRGRRTRLYWKAYDPFTGNKAYVKLKLKKKYRSGYRTVRTINYHLTKINYVRNYLLLFNNKGIYKFYVYAKDQAGNTQRNVAVNYIRVK